MIKKLSEESKKRYDMFWKNEALDRFLTFIVVGDRIENRPDKMSDADWSNYKWSDLDFRAKNNKEFFESAHYYLDGYPTQFIDFGPGSVAAYIGGSYEFAESTVWFDRNPIIKDWGNMPKIQFDENCDLWQKTLDYTDKILDVENVYASLTDLGGVLDIVASLRGSQKLLYDMYDYPDEVKALINTIRPLWKQAFNILTDRIAKRQDGFTSWMPIWCRQKYSPIQCDFSAMISPDMFEEFVLPDLTDLCNFLPKSIYHLDGPGELVHVDHLLSIPRLNAIQWMAGAGNPDPADETWFELYQKIQAGGKGLVIFSARPDLIEKLIKNISPKGVFLSVGKCDDYTAKHLSDMIEKFGLNK